MLRCRWLCPLVLATLEPRVRSRVALGPWDKNAGTARWELLSLTCCCVPPAPGHAAAQPRTACCSLACACHAFGLAARAAAAANVLALVAALAIAEAHLRGTRTSLCQHHMSVYAPARSSCVSAQNSAARRAPADLRRLGSPSLRRGLSASGREGRALRLRLIFCVQRVLRSASRASKRHATDLTLCANN